MSLNVRLRMKKFKSSLSRYWPTFALFALLLAIWQLTVSYAGIREYLLPAPLAVWNAMWHGEISWAQHLWFTTWEIIGAFLMAAVFGVLLGVGIAWSPLIANALVRAPVPIVWEEEPAKLTGKPESDADEASGGLTAH